ncbi:ParB-like nuclease domain protein [Arthrobacter phage Zaheer]|uniref:ParB-like nuclease domain protein n=1 Tax=Arthrobacter phage Zaheer TaxID=2836041 RepID=A0A8F3IP50_9CAUD|nr:ParB-like nuclease domain protein [Arthrobacter phage Zaheer]QWY84246.1 ParB-like nuclease domain protein [Arthrobacter phage Zaheer]
MSTNEFRNVAITELVPHPENPRTDLGSPESLSELANDLRAHGNKTALRVFPISEGEDQGKFLIIEGHRRRAAAELGLVAELFCEIDPTVDTLPKQLVCMLRENTHRVQISAVNEAQAIQTMMEFEGFTSVAKVAKAINRSQATVRKRLLLNKLSDQAKSRIEDNTLNIDQALVLVDFADNEEATQSLLEAASNPREWSWKVEAEVRKRDAPAKVATFEEELKEAGAQYLPEDQRYGSTWHRIYENDENALSTEEHVAAGHKALLDRTWGKLEWYEKLVSAKKPKPELTEEELEAKRRDAQLSAALEIAHAVRAEHIKRVIQDPPEGAARAALLELALSNIHAYTSTYAEMTGVPANDEDGHMALREALRKLSTDQLGLLIHLTNRSAEDSLLQLWAWDEGDYRHRYGPQAWLESLAMIYDYELSSVEQEVLDHFAELHEAEKQDQEQEEQEQIDA